MKTCLPIFMDHLSLLQLHPYVAAGKHAHELVSVNVGWKNRADQRSFEDRTSHSNRNAHKATEGDGKDEENVSAHLQASLQGNTNDGIKNNRPDIATIEQHKDQVFALAVAGDLLYSASASTDIRVFRAPLFEELGRFGSGNGIVNSLMLYGDRLYSAHQDNKIRVWKRVWNADAKCKHKLLAVLPRLDHFVKSILLERKYVQVRRHKKKLWIEHADTISALALGGRSWGTQGDDDGRCTPSVLYSASWDKTVKVWSLSNYKCIESFYAHNDAINAMIVIDGLVVATASADGSIKLWTRLIRKRKHSLLSTLHGHKAAVNALSVSANAKILYSGGSEGAVIAWKKVYNKPHARWNNHRNSTSDLSGEMIILRGSENCLEKYDSTTNGEGIIRENSLQNGLRRVSHHKRAVASNGIVSFVKRKVMVGHTRAVLSVSTVGDNIVCSSSADKTIRVWRREASPEQLRHRRRRSNSSGGGGEDRGGRSIWEYECLAVLVGHGGPVKSIACIVCPQHLIPCPNNLHSDSCTADRDDEDKHDHKNHDYPHHETGVVVYSAGLDSKVKVWVLPLR